MVVLLLLHGSCFIDFLFCHTSSAPRAPPPFGEDGQTKSTPPSPFSGCELGDGHIKSKIHFYFFVYQEKSEKSGHTIPDDADADADLQNDDDDAFPTLRHYNEAFPTRME